MSTFIRNLKTAAFTFLVPILGFISCTSSPATKEKGADAPNHADARRFYPSDSLLSPLTACDSAAFATPQRLGLLVVDAQTLFASADNGYGTPSTEDVAARIGRLVPVFRAATVPVYGIYYTLTPPVAENAREFIDLDFFKWIPVAGDIIIPKTKNSAFKGSAIDDSLRQRHSTRLLICGFNTSACVRETALDALQKKYTVYILSDLTTNGLQGPARNLNDTNNIHYTKTLAELAAAGAKVITSAQALTLLPPRR